MINGFIERYRIIKQVGKRTGERQFEPQKVVVQSTKQWKMLMEQQYELTYTYLHKLWYYQQLYVDIG